MNRIHIINKKEFTHFNTILNCSDEDIIFDNYTIPKADFINDDTIFLTCSFIYKSVLQISNWLKYNKNDIMIYTNDTVYNNAALIVYAWYHFICQIPYEEAWKIVKRKTNMRIQCSKKVYKNILKELIPYFYTSVECRINYWKTFKNLNMTLDLSHLDVDSFPDLSNEHIVSLDCSYTPLTHISSKFLPKTLKKFICEYTNIQIFDFLPSNLEYLSIKSRHDEELNIDSIPNSIKKLFIEGSFLKEISVLPENLKVLWLYSTYMLSSISYFPNFLREFYSHESSLSFLPNVPNTLKKLSCSYSSIRSIPNLPNEIKYISLFSNSLETISYLPDGILYINVCLNIGLPKITFLPKSILYCKETRSTYYKDNNIKYELRNY